MELLKIEKYLDTATTSCDTTSNVNDCYFLVPEKMRAYFSGVSEGLVDIETNKQYIFPIVDNREFRLTQFTQYINDKKITMGDQIIIYILRNNDNGLSFHIDTHYKDFFLQVNESDNLYKLYVSEEFQDLFLETNKIELPLDNDEKIIIEKIGNEYSIEGTDKKKFILEKDNDIYRIINLERAKATEIDASLVEDVDKELEYSSKKIVDSEELKKLFSEYIDNLSIQSKKIDKRLRYLDEILPKKLNEQNPVTIFSITDINELQGIRDTLRADEENWKWDEKYGREVLQTINYYIKFLQNIGVGLESKTQEEALADTIDFNEKSYINFLNIIENTLEEIELKNITSSIQFNIGQPNTGKSYNFEESKIFENVDSKYYRYLKIPVSGGIGNEYKGLQNTDLAITYDPIKKELRFGEFLQMLMSAIVNPKVPHVVFLDDFHNQDISSLLSEYTPLFKGQQKRDMEDIDSNHEIYSSTFSDVDEFIEKWNELIESHCTGMPSVPLTNRISGASLKLVYPSNFYLLGAANFNENSLNIFADWEDRAVINYIDPIESFTKEDEENEFFKCCETLNKELKELLENKKIFDYEKYCFGMWKIVNSSGSIITDEEEQKKLIKFFFSMIKNSLKHNNKNSEINSIGWELIVKMQGNDWFKTNIQVLINITDVDYKILHKHNIYEDEI